MPEIELKPCPFCGGKAKGTQYRLPTSKFSVGCETCGIRTLIYRDKEDAVNAWNRRTSSERN